MKIKAFIAQHKNESITECQDRFAINLKTKSLAVSDGVSQSIFPDYWAEILANSYVNDGVVTEDKRVILCDDWLRRVQNYIDAERAKGNNPWRTESNIAEGISAGATLCGLRFSEGFRWECNVIGDSCLVVIKDGTISNIYSSEDKAFDTYPDYLDSHKTRAGRGQFRTVSGQIDEQTTLMLVSDPFSDFFLKQLDRQDSQSLISDCLKVGNHAEFLELVSQLRDNGMHNDDSTMVVVEWDGEEGLCIDYADNLYELTEQERVEIESLPKETFNIEDNSLKGETEISAETTYEQEIVNGLDSTQMVLEGNDNTQSKECGESLSSSSSESITKEFLLNQIDSFVDGYVDQKSYSVCKECAILVRYLLKGKKTKDMELKRFLSQVLKAFINNLCK